MIQIRKVIYLAERPGILSSAWFFPNYLFINVVSIFKKLGFNHNGNASSQY